MSVTTAIPDVSGLADMNRRRHALDRSIARGAQVIGLQLDPS
jgi:hypothetical protein